MDRGFPRFDRACHLDGATEEQQLFGQGGFTGIGMADDAEGSSFFYFFAMLTAHVVFVSVWCLSGPLKGWGKKRGRNPTETKKYTPNYAICPIFILSCCWVLHAME